MRQRRRSVVPGKFSVAAGDEPSSRDDGNPPVATEILQRRRSASGDDGNAPATTEILQRRRSAVPGKFSVAAGGFPSSLEAERRRSTTEWPRHGRGQKRGGAPERAPWMGIRFGVDGN